MSPTVCKAMEGQFSSVKSYQSIAPLPFSLVNSVDLFNEHSWSKAVQKPHQACVTCFKIVRNGKQMSRRLKKECEKVWKEALQLSMAESSQASVSGERAQSDASSSSAEVDIMAAAKACRNSELPRR